MARRPTAINNFLQILELVDVETDRGSITLPEGFFFAQQVDPVERVTGVDFPILLCRRKRKI